MDNLAPLTYTPYSLAEAIAPATISLCVAVVLLLTRKWWSRWGWSTSLVYCVLFFSILVFIGSFLMLAEGPEEYEIVSTTGQVTEKRAEYIASSDPALSGTAHIVIVDGEEFVMREEVFDWLEVGETVTVKYQPHKHKRVIRVEKVE